MFTVYQYLRAGGTDDGFALKRLPHNYEPNIVPVEWGRIAFDTYLGILRDRGDSGQRQDRG